MIKGLQIIEGKYSNHIINDSHACDVCWWDWRQAKDVTNFVDDSINVNTLITDDWETIFIFLDVFNNFMNLGEFFRLDVNKGFVQVVQGNFEDLVRWDKYHKFFHVILDVVDSLQR